MASNQRVLSLEEQFFGEPTDLAHQLQMEMREKRQETQEKWRTFDEERDRVVKANRMDDQVHIDRLQELENDYREASKAWKDVERRWQTEALKAVQIPAEGPGEAEKAWSRATFRKLYESKALDGTTGGTIPPPYYDPALRRLPAGNLFVRSVLPIIKSDGGDSLSYLRQTVRTNNAAPVAAGGTKPTSTFTVERVTVPYSTIAHVSEEIDRALLSDYEGLRQFLDSELRLGVLLAEEDQIVNGNGTFPELEGILGAGIGDQPRGTDTISDALLRGLNVVRNDGLVEPDAIVMNSADYENAALEKTDGSGEYIHGSPNDSPTPTPWGKRVIVSPVMEAGTALVGSFATGAAIYDREQPRVDFSEGGDLFVKNQLIFRGEERIALAVFRPAAFATVSDLTLEEEGP
jgi:HK97 family phage major capsid protein